MLYVLSGDDTDFSAQYSWDGMTPIIYGNLGSYQDKFRDCWGCIRQHDKMTVTKCGTNFTAFTQVARAC